jgi:hypothetical protein
VGSFWAYHQFSIAAFAACLVLIALNNWRVLRRVEEGAAAVAVRFGLIPAR